MKTYITPFTQNKDLITSSSEKEKYEIRRRMPSAAKAINPFGPDKKNFYAGFLGEQLMRVWAVPTLEAIFDITDKGENHRAIHMLGALQDLFKWMNEEAFAQIMDNTKVETSVLIQKQKDKAFASLVDVVGGTARVDVNDEALRFAADAILKEPGKAPRFLRKVLASSAGAIVFDTDAAEVYRVTKDEASLTTAILARLADIMEPGEAFDAARAWCVSVGGEGERDLPTTTHEKAFSGRSSFDTLVMENENVRDVLNRFVDAGYLTFDGKVYTWQGKTKALLAFFFGRLILGDEVDEDMKGTRFVSYNEKAKMPEQDIKRWFSAPHGIDGLGKSRSQSKERGKYPNGADAIEKIFDGWVWR